MDYAYLLSAFDYSNPFRHSIQHFIYFNFQLHLNLNNKDNILWSPNILYYMSFCLQYARLLDCIGID